MNPERGCGRKRIEVALAQKKKASEHRIRKAQQVPKITKE